jgi:hypothetical protein
MGDFDYNINNYSIPELKSLIGIEPDEPITYNTLHKTISTYLNNSANNKPLFNFFQKVQSKLAQDIREPLFVSSSIKAMNEDDDDEDDEEEEDNKDDDNKDDEEPSILGNMNPLKRATISKVINVDSLYRYNPDTTPSTEFTMNFPDIMENVLSIEIKSIQIQGGYYNITDLNSNNVFYIQTFNVCDVPDTTHTITVPPGNYTIEELTNIINNIISNLQGARLLWFSFNKNSNKIFVRVKNTEDPGSEYYAYEAGGPGSCVSTNFYYKLLFRTLLTDSDSTICDPEGAGGRNIISSDSIGWIMGFREEEYTVTKDDIFEDIFSTISTTIIHKGYICAPQPFVINTHDYLFLELDDFNRNFTTNNMVIRKEKNYAGKNLVARIPTFPSISIDGINLPPGENAVFIRRDYFGPVNIEKIHVRLITKYGHLHQLNGNFSFAINAVVQYG